MKGYRIVYEDDTIIVEVVDDNGVVMAVYDALKQLNRPVLLKELVEELKDYAGKNRIKQALKELLEQRLIVVYPGGRIGLPGLQFTKVKRRGKRIKILVD